MILLNNVNKQVSFCTFVHIFKETAVCKFLQALLGQSSYEMYITALFILMKIRTIFLVILI